jgi:hypothetical protein
VKRSDLSLAAVALNHADAEIRRGGDLDLAQVCITAAAVYLEAHCRDSVYGSNSPTYKRLSAKWNRLHTRLNGGAA